MTAVLALESHRLDEQFAVSAYAATTPPSKIGLRAGPARRACATCSTRCCSSRRTTPRWSSPRASSGSESAFADQMNLKARVIGAVTTNFVNPHGLTDCGHVTTARDLSRIFRYGLGVPGFREVLSTTPQDVPIDGPDARARHGAVAQPTAERARLPGDRQDRLHAARPPLLRRRRRDTARARS